MTQNPDTGEIEEITVFPRFDVVSDDSDHHYLTSNHHKKTNNNNAAATSKKIMQEWKILEKHLPDSIYVRVYENRIDLLRAAIIGASGTPYHDTLFFFDIAFPSDYPTRPPLVHYRSFGIRINPNLYSNGRVCLSLLNTWTGKRSEKWNPSESTVLQVLISIQALVLNEKPFFNEPGTGLWPGRSIWEKRSSAYNEDVLVLSLKSTIFVLRRPPKNFETLVVSHYKERGHVILSACRSYVHGHVRVGFYTNDGPFCSCSDGSSCSSSFDVSERFKALILQLYPALVTVFVNAGATSLGSLVEPLKVEKKTVAFKGEEEKGKTMSFLKEKKKSGFAKVLRKIKVVLGLKKKE